MKKSTLAVAALVSALSTATIIPVAFADSSAANSQVGCTGCKGCKGCAGCKGCKGCNGCKGCKGCGGCAGS